MLLADFVEPNLHIAVIHFPIALVVMGVLAECVAGVFGARSLRSAARWMVLLGAMMALPVAVSGLYALQDLVRQGESAYTPWHEATAVSHLSAAQWAALTRHAQIQSVAAVMTLLLSAFFLGCSDAGRRAFYVPVLALFLLAAGGILVGSHIGGQTVFRDGTGVNHTSRPHIETESDDPTDAETFAPETGAVGGAPASTRPMGLERTLVSLLPPLQAHGLVAGAAISLGVVAIALAFRNANQLRAPAAKPAGGRPMYPGTGRGNTPPAEPLLPASRLLMLASVVTLLAAGLGVWHLSIESGTRVPRELWETVLTFPPGEVAQAQHRDELRRIAHVAVGSVLLVIPMLLALWTRVRPGGRLVLTFLAVLYVLAAAGQLWMGGLLLLDTPVGPITGLSAPAAE